MMGKDKVRVTIIILASGLLMAVSSCYAQAPVWAWANSGMATTSSTIGSRTDGTGNLYTAGLAVNGVFGSITLPEGMFLAKHDSQGNLIWAKTANCTPYALCTDAVGNSYITGKFQDTLLLGTDTLICQGRYDMFIVKYDNAGSVIWAKRAGGAAYSGWPWPVFNEDVGYSIGVDANGNCFVGGVVMPTSTIPVNFDSIQLYSPLPFPGPGYMMNVLAKYNAAGEIQWVRTMENPGGGEDAVRAMAVSAQGDCYITGVFADFISFNGDTVYSNGNLDICYARYDTDGNVLWAKTFGGPGGDHGNDIAFNELGELFLTGTIKDSVRVGTFDLISTPTGNAVFVLKIDSATGNPIWASQTSVGALEPKIAVDNTGSSYVCCSFSGNVSIGHQTFTSIGFYDPLVIKWNGGGQPVWAKAAQGVGSDYAKGIALNPDYTACYLTGTFQQSLIFGNDTISTGPNSNYYLAKLENIVSAASVEMEAPNWLIYPNPTHGRLHLKMPEQFGNSYATLTDVRGQVVYSAAVGAISEAIMELPNLPQGVYILTVQNEWQVLRKKVLLQH